MPFQFHTFLPSFLKLGAYIAYNATLPVTSPELIYQIRLSSTFLTHNFHHQSVFTGFGEHTSTLFRNCSVL